MEIQNIPITRITAEGAAIREDMVAVEAQYQTWINGDAAFSFTCTPSHLEEMITGTLYSRGLIRSAGEIGSLRIDGAQIHVTLREGTPVPECGAERAACPDDETIFRTVRRVFSDPDTLFNRTGCAHSCALMRAGEILCAFEDIGRHNALDKVIGFALQKGIPMCGCVIFTSGRISGDYMAKIIRAGFPVAVSRAAVTSEAVRLAKEHGVTLYGFVRGSSANRYNP